ncbi:hypothetical protein GIB67_017364, partial [Kingdonia uniflora]
MIKFCLWFSDPSFAIKVRGNSFVALSVLLFIAIPSLLFLLEFHMFSKSDLFSRLTEMGCCSYFGFIRKTKRSLRPT